MKLIYRYLFLSVCLFLLSASCGGNKNKTAGEETTYASEDFKKFIANDLMATWRYAKLVVNETEHTTLVPCQEDLRVRFLSNNTFKQTYLGAKCPEPYTGTWKFDASTNQLVLTNPTETTVAKVVAASSSSFELEIAAEGDAKILLTLARVEDGK